MKSQGISETKRFVFDVKAEQNKFTKIDQKLPQDAEIVTGIYFSIAHTDALKGTVSLRFSEGISSPLLHQLVRTTGQPQKKVKMFSVVEPVTDNSTLQGYYLDRSGASYTGYTLKIYVEYIPRA